MSAQQQGAVGCAGPGDSIDMLIGRRNIEGGPRNFDYIHDNYRVVLGSKGKLWGPFSYDLYGSYYYTSVFVGSNNFLSISRAQNALLGCPNGNADGCVPYNILTQGGVTNQALNYLQESGTSRGTTTERIIEGTITGDLGEWGVKSPWATDAVGVSAGFQVRRDSLTFNPDQAELSNDLSGFAAPA